MNIYQASKRLQIIILFCFGDILLQGIRTGAAGVRALIILGETKLN